MDPFQVLGISKNSTDDEIKKAYKNLAKIYHPDKGGDEEKFKEISNAYSQIMKSDDISEILKNLFGSIKPKGPTTYSTLKLTIRELERGGKFKIKYKRNVPTGNIINTSTNTPFGYISMMCPEEETREYETEVFIPPCHDERFPLIFENYAKGEGVVDGDIEVRIIINDDKLERITGTLDLVLKITITLKEALTGFRKELDLIGATVDCNSIVNPYECKELDGYGMYKNDKEIGNLFLKFVILFPTELSDDSKNKLSEIL